jgi:hypothetical protein
MNALANSNRTALIEAAFDAAGLEFGAIVRAGAWVVAEHADGAHNFHAFLYEDWLGFLLELSHAPVGSFVDTLTLNAALAGAARLVTRINGSIWIAADLCVIDSEDTLHERVKSTVVTLSDGARRYKTPADDETIAIAASVHEAIDLAPVVDALTEAGWDVQLDDLGCRVTIRAADRSHRATVHHDADGGCSVRVEVAPVDGAPETAREAAALLMLRTANALRMVSPQARTADGQTAFVFAGWFDLARAATDAAHLLNALSLALDSCAEEVRVLVASEELAGVYLATQGFRLDAAQVRVMGLDRNAVNE